MTTVDRQPAAASRTELASPCIEEAAETVANAALPDRDEAMDAASPTAIKRARVLAVARERGADRVVLTSVGATSWYLDGARTHVSLATGAILAVVVSAGGDIIRVYSNEYERIRYEELGASIDAELVLVPWHLDLTDGIIGAGTLLEADAERELRLARASLLPHERERYAALGADIARAFTVTLSHASPSDSERAIAGELARSIIEAGADPIVVLTSGASRLRHRHPLPTEAALGQRAMAVVGARRAGLMVSATRWVAFRPLTVAERARQAALREVEHAFLLASSAGRTLDAAFADGISAYGANGFDVEEWRRHHQGGPTGYFGRDPKASSLTRELIVDHQAFAWNPSVGSDKVEDTVILSAGVPRVLTHDHAWPSLLHRGVPRADTLVLS